MFTIIGTIFTITLGIIFHFLYKLSNKNKILAYFVPINESVWEHIKLVIVPSLIWFIFELHHYPYNHNIWIAEYLKIFTMGFTITFLYYSYQKILKRNIFIIDIIIYIISVILGMFIFTKIINLEYLGLIPVHIGIIGLILIIIKLFTSTYTPGKEEIYQEPLKK